MRRCGAAEVVDSRQPKWSDALAPVDRVLDLVGRATFAGSVHALARGGRLIFAGGTSGGDLSFNGWDFMRAVTLAGHSSESLSRDALRGAIARIADLAASGALAAKAVTRFPLADAADAHRAMESGALQGRVVLVG